MYLVEYSATQREWATEDSLIGQCETNQEEVDLFPLHEYAVGSHVRKYFGSLYRGRHRGYLNGKVCLPGYSGTEVGARTYLVEYDGGHREWLSERKVEKLACET